MALVQSVNVGVLRSVGRQSSATGIDKVPSTKPVMVTAPGPKGTGTGGLAGDVICDVTHHGGDNQAVYAYAREDLDWWQAELGEPLRSGMFGENLTTLGLDITEALIGETWRIGEDVVLQVTGAAYSLFDLRRVDRPKRLAQGIHPLRASGCVSARPVGGRGSS